LWLAALLLMLGSGLLVAGSQLLVTGAVSIATNLGISSLVVGLTVVAIGTSLPELATALVAIRRGERDMAVGNIVGSNLFNIGLVLGLPAMIFDGGIPVPPAAIAMDIPLMLAATLALVPLAFTGFVFARWEGILFVALYLAYLLYCGAGLHRARRGPRVHHNHAVVRSPPCRHHLSRGDCLRNRSASRTRGSKKPQKTAGPPS
jgi:cation:H+ antiporter